MRLTKYRSAERRERAPPVPGSSASRELCCSATESFAGKLPHKQVERATKAFWRQPTRNILHVYDCEDTRVYVYVCAASFHRSLPQNGDKCAHIHIFIHTRAHIYVRTTVRLNRRQYSAEYGNVCVPHSCSRVNNIAGKVTQTPLAIPAGFKETPSGSTPSTWSNREINDCRALRGNSIDIKISVTQK